MNGKTYSYNANPNGHLKKIYARLQIGLGPCCMHRKVKLIFLDQATNVLGILILEIFDKIIYFSFKLLFRFGKL